MAIWSRRCIIASGNTLVIWEAASYKPLSWIFLVFTGGSTEPTADGDGTAVIWGDTSNAQSVLEFLVLTSGTWGSGDAAGYMLCSQWNGVDYQAENFTADSGTPADHGTLAGVQVSASAITDRRMDDPVVDFDAATNKVCFFNGIMPQHYAGGGLTVTIGVRASTATTGDMSFAGFFKSLGNNVDDIDVKNFADPQFNTAIDAPTTSGFIRYFDITFTDGAQIDSLAAGEYFQFMLMRDAQDGTNDDMAGDGEVVSIEIKET